MYSQHPRYAQNPPLPHQAQPHFYRAPDANALLSAQIHGILPGEKGYHCGFDSLSKENVVLAGYEGGVKIYSVSKRGLSATLGIEGLRGGVHNAKILPWTVEGMSARHFPLIALVVHGPVWASGASSGEDAPSSRGSPPIQNGSIRGSPRLQTFNNEDIDYYQTTVEVYSLSGSKPHIATLLALPESRLKIPTASPSFRTPPPVGSLTIRADNGNVVVASGTTGETWIFRQGNVDSNAPDKFKCIGKVWTTVQQGVTVDPAGVHGPTDGVWPPLSPVSAQQSYKASVLSLNGRWLAYCPSTPSSQVSLRATVPCAGSTTRIPGLHTQAPPQLPWVNCGVETPGGESVMKQMVQAGAQKLIEVGNYLAGQGMQYWNDYRSKPASGQPVNGGGMGYQPHPGMAQQFPPTHGLPAPAPLVTKDPGLISILDLDSLARHPSSNSSSLHPVATFRVPHGCSFLSLAPSGLALFTASSKGDIQSVWDLMRLQYAKSSFLKVGLQNSGIHGPHVREIAQFSRLTIARIVDVVWTSPHGERAAVVTEPGTIHILDLPASAFTWPPPRRRVSVPKPENSTGDGASSTLATATGVASSAVNSLWTVARPLVNRRRRSSGGISARAVTAQAGHGTQALAAGISRSVGAAAGRMNEMRKSGSGKLHLPSSKSVPSRGCVLLLNGKRNDSVIALGGGCVRLYNIKNRRADRPADKQKSSIKMSVEFTIPSLPDFKIAPDIARELHQAGDLELTERDIEETRWKDRSPPPASASRGTDPITQAEIESNAPYQPFHTDRRVALHTFSPEEALPPSPSVSALLSPPRSKDTPQSPFSAQPQGSWVFGGPIKATKLDVGPLQNPDDDFDDSVDHRALPSSSIERVTRVSDSSDQAEHIVITTRRRKGGPKLGVDETGNADEEGFFEDDCEVLDFASQRV